MLSRHSSFEQGSQVKFIIEQWAQKGVSKEKAEVPRALRTKSKVGSVIPGKKKIQFIMRLSESVVHLIGAQNLV